MARSDLLVALVKAGSSGDKRGVRSAAEAIIAEERAKQHNILANRLSQATQVIFVRDGVLRLVFLGRATRHAISGQADFG